MNSYPLYQLPVPRSGRGRLCNAWLMLAVAALILSGLFAVLIVLSRMPYIGDVFPWVDFFQVALVVHVDLSVLVWLLAFAGVFWSVTSSDQALPVAWAGWGLAVLGTLVITASPFVGAGPAIMNNYVPVLDAPVFLTGLFLFGLGFAALTVYGCAAAEPLGRRWDGAAALRFGGHTALVASALALVSLAWTFLDLPRDLGAAAYYEALFWGGGHVIQITFTQLMLIAWLWLAGVAGLRVPMTPRLVIGLLLLGLLPAFATPLIHLAHEVVTYQYRQSMTAMMIYGGGLAALPLGLALVIALLRGAGGAPATMAPRHSLLAALGLSVALFGVGGILGFMITESNVIIPAHYHGSITAVTLAFMGLTYHLLPALGYRLPSARLVTVQPYVYGIGQLVHVLGLAWSGGHGVQRKTAGADQGLEGVAEILGMAVMGMGGLVAVIGGVLYLVIVLLSVRRGRNGDVVSAPGQQSANN